MSNDLEPGIGNSNTMEFFNFLVSDFSGTCEAVEALASSQRSEDRERAINILVSANPAAPKQWVDKLESALFYASGCGLDKQYLDLVRQTAANLRRSSDAWHYDPCAWPFLSLIVLSRGNKKVHCERINFLLDTQARSGKIVDIDKNRLLAEIEQYRVTDPALFEELSHRFAEQCREEVEDEFESRESCPECSQKKTRVLGEIKATSADEPSLLMYNCQNCGFNFKL